MEDPADSQNTSESIALTDEEVFTQIWFAPKRVFKFINDTGYEKYMYVLLCLSGISRAFDRASTNNMGDNMSLPTVVLICVIVGGLFGWMSFYIYSALISWTGKWLQGKGDTGSIIRILAYSMLPNIAAMVLLIPLLIRYGNQTFQSATDLTSDDEIDNMLLYTIYLLDIILTVWTLLFAVVGLSEVQKFSIGKSILNIILPGLVIFVPLLLIVYFVKAF
jgi:hypothetical protein